MRGTALIATVLFWGLIGVMHPQVSYAQFTPSTGGGQIQFGQFYNVFSGITAINANLEFGTLIAGESKSVNLGSDEEAVFLVEGLPFLDVIITITGDALTGPNTGFLYLDGNASCAEDSCRIQVMFGYAFDNSGSPNYDANLAHPFTVSPILFPIRRRAMGTPPGPPPTPQITDVALPDPVSSYLFIYGTISSNTSNLVGSYQSTLNIEVVYN